MFLESIRTNSGFELITVPQNRIPEEAAKHERRQVFHLTSAFAVVFPKEGADDIPVSGVVISVELYSGRCPADLFAKREPDKVAAVCVLGEEAGHRFNRRFEVAVGRQWGVDRGSDEECVMKLALGGEVVVDAGFAELRAVCDHADRGGAIAVASEQLARDCQDAITRLAPAFANGGGVSGHWRSIGSS